MPCYEKDEIVWVRDAKGDYKRSDEERNQLFQTILSQENWIVEGTLRKVLQESFEEAEMIVFLNPSFSDSLQANLPALVEAKAR